jgi:hypothetical protein
MHGADRDMMAGTRVFIEISRGRHTAKITHRIPAQADDQRMSLQ